MALPVCKPLQRPEIGFRKRQNPLMGNHTSGMTKPRILEFLRLLWLRCLNDKTSHRFQGEGIADCLQSQIFDRRERKMSNLDGLTAWKSAVHRKPIAIKRFAAHSSTSAKRKMKPRFGVGLYITYRDILNIGSYNWQLQKGLLKHSFCIKIYLYRAIQYHAVLPVKNCTPISLYIHTCYNPIQVYLV